jgi:hypothetical protein
MIVVIVTFDYASFDKVKLPSHLALAADDRAIGGFHVSLPLQCDPHGKTGRRIVLNDLNAGNGLTARPQAYGVKARFSESRIACPIVLSFAILTTVDLKQSVPAQPSSLGRCGGQLLRKQIAMARDGTGQSDQGACFCMHVPGQASRFENTAPHRSRARSAPEREGGRAPWSVRQKAAAGVEKSATASLNGHDTQPTVNVATGCEQKVRRR